MLWPPASPEAFLQMLKDENSVVYNNIAASSFLFWEYVITFSGECELIWRGEWSYITVLYLFSRYFALGMRIIQLLVYANVTGLLNPTPGLCLGWLKLEIVAHHALAFAVDLVLASRAYAVHAKDRKVLYLLTAILVAGQLAAIACLVVVIGVFRAGPLPIPHHISFGACVTLTADPRFHNYFLVTIIVETLLTILFAVKFAPFIFSRATPGSRLSRLMVVFVRDGLWAYSLVCAILVRVYISYRINPQGDMAIAWLYSVLSFTATRLILNLRTEACKGRLVGGDGAVELTSIQGRDTTRSLAGGLVPSPDEDFVFCNPETTTYDDMYNDM